jgi:hypothetical protein
MSGAYIYCWNLSGYPICGNNVTNMYNAYYRCYDISGNAYFYSNKVSNVGNCFRDVNKTLNVYVPANSVTLNTCLRTSYGESLSGTSVTWTNDYASNGCYYNTQCRIYIYPVENVRASYLDNEYDIIANPMNVQDKNINLTNKSLSIKTEWNYQSAPLTIDSGIAYVMTINTSDLQNITVENMEVK